MLTLKQIRDDKEAAIRRLAKKGVDAAPIIAKIEQLDDRRKAIQAELDSCLAEQNAAAKQIGMLKKKGEDTSSIEARVREIGDRIRELDRVAEENAAQLTSLLMNIPNLPHLECPVGADETANPEIKLWGEKPAIENPKDHVELAANLGMISFEDGARITGSGFVVYRGAGARLERALINFLLNTQTVENGYQEVGVPFVVKRECMEGTGQLPKFEEDMYGTEDQQMFLIPTAEVPVTNLYRDTILQESDLPIKMAAYTPCFRREAGSAGRINRGMIRVHQFDKVELVQILKPEDSFRELEVLRGHAESILQKLGLHYRVIELCTGDLGFSSAKTYDIEVWAPGQGQYLEVSSCSCFTDYQARRMRLRYKDADGRNQFCHTLNGSGTALPRLYVALLETYQQPDGSIRIPEALVPYFGADCIRPEQA